MNGTPMAPPPPPMPAAGGGPGGKATTAGVIEIVLGALIILLSFALMALVNDVDSDLPSWVGAIVWISFLEGGLNLLAGILILRRKQAGRILGIAICSIGIAIVLVNLGAVSPLVVIGIALRVLVIVMLVQSSSEFA